MELEGAAAIVTGAAMGTGRAIARSFAARGARVVVAGIVVPGGRETVRMIESEGGRAVFVPADVTVAEQVHAMVDAAEAAHGRLDVLVNNAGGSGTPVFPVAHADTWVRCIALNLLGPMHAIQAALPVMARRGGGAIVNVASMAGIGGAPNPWPEYAAAKAGLIRLTESLAPLHGRMGVRVNCLAPNWILTERTRELLDAMTPEERTAVPPPLSTPEDIADAVLEVVRDERLAGRVLMWWNERPHLVPIERWSAWLPEEP